jgi:hypothetical protein
LATGPIAPPDVISGDADLTSFRTDDRYVIQSSATTLVQCKPLRAAILRGSAECAELLLPYYTVGQLTEMMAVPNPTPNTSNIPLESLAMLAVRYDRAQLVEKMIAHGVDFLQVTWRKDTNEMTGCAAVQWALYTGSKDTARVLLRNMVDRGINLHTPIRNRPLIADVRSSSMLVILMKAGYDLTLPVESHVFNTKIGNQVVVNRTPSYPTGIDCFHMYYIPDYTEINYE